MADTIWLVDVGYVVKASKGKFKLDYVLAERLLTEMLGPTSTFIFNGFDQAYGIPEDLQRFYDLMRRHGMQVRLQPMQSGPAGTNRQRRVDVDFSAHMVWQASLPEVRTLVLTTGDQDFIPAIELVQKQFGKRAICFSYRVMVHGDLVKAVDEWWLFEDYRERIARAPMPSAPAR